MPTNIRITDTDLCSGSLQNLLQVPPFGLGNHFSLGLETIWRLEDFLAFLGQHGVITGVEEAKGSMSDVLASDFRRRCSGVCFVEQ